MRAARAGHSKRRLIEGSGRPVAWAVLNGAFGPPMSSPHAWWTGRSPFAKRPLCGISAVLAFRVTGV